MEQVMSLVPFRAESFVGRSEFVQERVIPASPEAVWDVLSEIGSIADWNPGVRRSYVVDEAPIGEGSVRVCELGSKHFLNELVVRFERHHALTMRITESSIPFVGADIRFTLTEMAEGTLVQVSPTYTLKFGLLGWLVDVLFFRRAYRKGMASLLTGLEGGVLQRLALDDNSSAAGGQHHLGD